MSHETEFQEAGLVWTFRGNISYDEIIAANSEAWNRADWDELKYQICDFTNAESIELGEEDMKAASYTDRAAVQRRGLLKVAIVATKPEVVKVCHFYMDQVDGEKNISAALFPNRLEAFVWARS